MICHDASIVSLREQRKAPRSAEGKPHSGGTGPPADPNRLEKLRQSDVVNGPLELDCLACGTTLRFEPGLMFTNCGICEEPRPLPMRFSGLPETPDGSPGGPEFHGVLPFLIDESAARLALQEEAVRHDQTPLLGDFERVFVPVVVMRCHAKGDYYGKRGDLRGAGNHQHMVWSPVSGTCERPFDNVVRFARLPAPPEPYLALDPWDWAFVLPFDHVSARTQVEEATVFQGWPNSDDVFDQVFPSISQEMYTEAAFDIGGDDQRVDGVTSTRSEATYRTVLLPVWRCTLKTTEATCVVNGRTGRACIAGFDPPKPEASPFAPASSWVDAVKSYAELAFGIAVVVLVIGVYLAYRAM